MSKTIKSLINNAELQSEMWKQIAFDSEALKDRKKTKEQALMLSNYFQGRADGLCVAFLRDDTLER